MTFKYPMTPSYLTLFYSLFGQHLLVSEVYITCAFKSVIKLGLSTKVLCQHCFM